MSEDDPAEDPSERHEPRRTWFLRGAREIFSIPGLILASAFVGFAGLAQGAGLTLAQTIFMTAAIWALPAQVVMVGGILAGSGLPAVAFAVALSSVRLTPMVVTLVPELRADNTRNWVLYALSHFVAVTSWVIAMERVRQMPRRVRTTFYAGLGMALVTMNVTVVTVVFALAGRLPPVVSAALFMLTPIYFLTSLWGSARERAGQVAMLIGLVLGPLFHLVVPGLDLVATGIVGGLAAYGFHKLAAGRRSA